MTRTLRSRIRRPWRRHMPEPIQRTDLRAFRAISRWRTPLLDRTLPRLSRSANRSALWLGISAGMWLSGNRRARRAAMRGLMAVGLSSAVANAPAKLLFRRHRPDHEVPVARRLRRMPTSMSFPSGHAASASAFAVGAAIEQPALGFPLGALASGVAFSRIYTGAHYPTDVLAGIAIGAGVAAATTRFWPTVHDEAASARAVLRFGSVDPSPDGAGLSIVVNTSAGPALSVDPTDALIEALPRAAVTAVDDGDGFVPAIEHVVGDARAIGAAGGDGSINIAAAVAHRAGKPLVVVPNGTLNHFARDLGIDTVDEAIAAVRDGEVAAVDLALIDDKPFLNTASIGFYPELVDRREKLEARIGKWPALLWSLLTVLPRHEPLDIEIAGARRRVWTVFIGNGRYVPSGFAPNRRERLDEGCFDVRIVTAEKRFALLRLIGALLTGRLDRCSVYVEQVVPELKVRSMRGPLRLARDGETFDGSEAFTVTKAQEPLQVYVPKRDQ